MTCELVLVRHAKSSWRHHMASDYQRPLAKRGLRQATLMAQRQVFIHEDALLLCSPSVRTMQTASLMLEGKPTLQARLRLVPELYEATLPQLLKLITATPDSVQQLVLVGHNPGLADLVLHLTDNELIKFTTAMQIRITLPNWHQAGNGAGVLTDVIYAEEGEIG
nr:histidine phosphatase family protein [Plesiomonas shigelloides]